jgi:hypothetical protein
MDLPTAFRYFDTDGNGYLTANEIVNILTMQSGGQPLSPQDAQAFIQCFDTDANGGWDYNEFCTAMAAMQQAPPPQLQAVAQPVAAQPMMAQPMAAQPMMAQPMMAQPMMAQPAAAEPQVPCANGTLFLHGRVQTQWDEGPDCDYRYYLGNVTAIHSNSTATITYDDNDSWTGETKWMYEVPSSHPGYARSDGGVGFATLNG